ncbi:MAG: hypothetical protein LUM44_09030 [Pyrinomonadaceae bacterium]|nr:hypothetical protein [Pyrinomonadaceae bacterium]
MKNTIKLFFVIVLFCSTVFADGTMGAGGLTDDGTMGAGGRTCTSNCAINKPTVDPKKSSESETTSFVIDFIQDYLNSIFG